MTGDGSDESAGGGDGPIEGPDDWRSIARRAGSYAGEQVVRLLLTAIVGIFVARHLGPEGLGLLSYAQATFGLLIPIVLLGMPTVLVREFSTDPVWKPLLASAVAVQLPMALIVAAGGFLVVAGARDFEQQAVLTALALVPLPILTIDQSIRSYLEATGRSRVILISGIVGAVIASLVKIAAIMVGAEVWVFALAGSIELAIVAIGHLGVFSRRSPIGAIRRHFRVERIRAVLAESWPLLLSAIAVTLYMRADLVMLGILADDRETGIYAAAARLSEVWYFVPVAAAAALRPTLARIYANGDEATYGLTLQRFMAIASGAGYVAVIAALAGGRQAIAFLYGEAFSPSVEVLQLHILAAPFVFLGVAAGPWFTDRRLSGEVLKRSGIGAILNLALNFALIPTRGAQGAAIATLLSYAVSGVLLNAASRISRPLFLRQVRALALRWR